MVEIQPLNCQNLRMFAPKPNVNLFSSFFQYFPSDWCPNFPGWDLQGTDELGRTERRIGPMLFLQVSHMLKTSAFLLLQAWSGITTIFIPGFDCDSGHGTSVCPFSRTRGGSWLPTCRLRQRSKCFMIPGGFLQVQGGDSQKVLSF